MIGVFYSLLSVSRGYSHQSIFQLSWLTPTEGKMIHDSERRCHTPGSGMRSINNTQHHLEKFILSRTIIGKYSTTPLRN